MINYFQLQLYSTTEMQGRILNQVKDECKAHIHCLALNLELYLFHLLCFP